MIIALKKLLYFRSLSHATWHRRREARSVQGGRWQVDFGQWKSPYWFCGLSGGSQ